MTGPVVVKLAGEVAVRFHLRTQIVGPFDSFDHAADWIDRNLGPTDDYVITGINDPTELTVIMSGGQLSGTVLLGADG